ncbi:hypothetical protein HK101_005687 [Irineochytrium annulatum]|nr:hypothetical protein HK101_005687 [Irineochytrium annulatum]
MGDSESRPRTSRRKAGQRRVVPEDAGDQSPEDVVDVMRPDEVEVVVEESRSHRVRPSSSGETYAQTRRSSPFLPPITPPPPMSTEPQAASLRGEQRELDAKEDAKAERPSRGSLTNSGHAKSLAPKEESGLEKTNISRPASLNFLAASGLNTSKYSINADYDGSQSTMGHQQKSQSVGDNAAEGSGVNEAKTGGPSSIVTSDNSKSNTNHRNSQTAQLPALKDDHGRRIVIEPSGASLAASDKCHNFDPYPYSRSELVIRGPIRILLFPFILLGTFITTLIRNSIYGSMKGKFIDNTVRTARYGSVLDFIPKQIIVQFSKLANVYFLLICILQAVPGWSSTGQYTNIFPLSFFVLLAMVKEGWEDYHRHLHDSAENGMLAKRLRVKSTGDSADNVFVTRNGECLAVDWVEILWKDIQVGAIICIERGEAIPADVIVLCSSTPSGACYIETSNLDGESNLKQKQAVSVTQSLIKDLHSFGDFSCKIQAESSNGQLNHFEGYIDLEKHSKGKHALTINQMLPRGTVLCNTDYVYGVAIYTGEETKIRKNATKAAESKAPSLERLTNKIVILMFFVVLLLSALSTIFLYIWDSSRRLGKNGQPLHWYLDAEPVSYPNSFFTFLILYDTMIPISLYVAMEFVKLVQAFFINNDLLMYDELSDTAAEARTSNLHEELGQVQYLFTDKTGTLTQNVMVFKKLSVGGVSYSHGDPSPNGDQGSVHGSICHPTTNLITEILSRTSNITATNELDPQLQHAVEFLLAITLCHTVVPERTGSGSHHQRKVTHKRIPSLKTLTSANAYYQIPSDDMSITYQSSSPDEIALVEAARELTFILRGRTITTVTLNVFLSSREVTYSILHTIEFSSKRKRMSVIYRYPDGRIMLLCKGADSVILERLKEPAIMSPPELEVLEKTMEQMAQFATEGLRTLLFASRVMSQEEYEEWAERWSLASLALHNRTQLMEDLAEEVECGLGLLGSTAIEDRLQTGVPETIDKLRRAGIKVWMLTGDKRETAINIAYTCELVKETSEVILVEGATTKDLEKSIHESTAKCIASRHPVSAPFVSCNSAPGNLINGVSKAHIVVAIDGDALSKLEVQHASYLHCSATKTLSPDGKDVSYSLLERFVELGIKCDGVVCCRFSPAQKALIVSQVREQVRDRHGLSSYRQGRSSLWQALYYTFVVGPHPSGVTLAIGDGANDIPMIQCAHVGVGITGREGLAASRASDYAIAQFRFLQPLLFVHGRWSYVRICLFTLGTFYKCVTFYLTQTIFQIFTGWSGTSLFEPYTLTLYNILFSSLPVIVIGIFEKDLNKSTILSVPELYRFGSMNTGLNMSIFIKWVSEGVWHALVACMVPFIMYNGVWDDNGLNLSGGATRGTRPTLANNDPNVMWFSDMSGPDQEASLYALGVVTYSVVVLLVNIKVCYLNSYNWNMFTHIAFWLSIAVWWVFLFAYSGLWPRLGHSIGPETASVYVALNASWLRIILVHVVSMALAFGAFDTLIRRGVWSLGAGNNIAKPAEADVVVATKLEEGTEKLEEGAEKHANLAPPVAIETLGPSHGDLHPPGSSVGTPTASIMFHSNSNNLSPAKLQNAVKDIQSRKTVKRSNGDQSYIASGCAAERFARQIIANHESIEPRIRRKVRRKAGHVAESAEAGGVADEIEWSLMTPLWQLWERRNDVRSCQEAGRDMVTHGAGSNRNGRDARGGVGGGGGAGHFLLSKNSSATSGVAGVSALSVANNTPTASRLGPSVLSISRVGTKRVSRQGSSMDVNGRAGTLGAGGGGGGSADGPLYPNYQAYQVFAQEEGGGGGGFLHRDEKIASISRQSSRRRTPHVMPAFPEPAEDAHDGDRDAKVVITVEGADFVDGVAYQPELE